MSRVLAAALELQPAHYCVRELDEASVETAESRTEGVCGYVAVLWHLLFVKIWVKYIFLMILSANGRNRLCSCGSADIKMH